MYREAHTLLEERAEATLAGTRKDYLGELATAPLLIIDDLGMRTLAHTAAEGLLDPIMRRTNGRRPCSRRIDRSMSGQAPRRHRSGHRAARPLAPPHARARMRTTELAHQVQTDLHTEEGTK